MDREISRELKRHAPFTAAGAATGILVMILTYHISYQVAHKIFFVLHPLHVLLSAMVTTAMYRLHSKNPKLLPTILIGYFGSIGIASLSDCIIPYIGESLLNLPNKGIHFGFIEKWWLVNPLAFLGIAIAFRRPRTKVPHLGHVLLSTWASLFHMIMALGGILTLTRAIVIFVFLFIAVWFPCCLSDIIFPLLFIGKKNEKNPNTV